MSDAPEIVRHDGLGRKLGPLPIWGWALVLAAVAFIWVRFMGKGSSSSSTGSSSSQALPNVMTTGGYLPPTSGSGSTGSGSAGAFTDNQSWENAAMQQASAYGSTPVDIQGALSNFLNGDPLSSDQSSIVNKVVQALGAPPTGTNGVSTVTPAQTIWQQEASSLLDMAFGGNFTNQDSQLVDKNSSKQTAINTWANALQGGVDPAVALQRIEAGPAHQQWTKQGGK